MENFLPSHSLPNSPGHKMTTNTMIKNRIEMFKPTIGYNTFHSEDKKNREVDYNSETINFTSQLTEKVFKK